ncbi:glycoside hydrolase family 16 protein [Curtobacterium sp. RRHDQ10]|uniref:glycoside hydrolase family 16 protein n=1 Tax=Curtobacterium phyllosphaerae TaxID=3413379 RepID=UPI003BF0E95A
MRARPDRRALRRTGRSRVALLLAGALTVVLAGCSAADGGGDPTSTATGSSSASPSGNGTAADGATGDQFDGPAGSPPDPSIWTAQTGGGGWGNGEVQTYTSSAVALDGKGHLVITATAHGPASHPTYTSGRITTQHKLSWTTGTLSARMKLPDGTGLLPAFWLLGADVDSVGWPRAGEIDIVETPNTTSRSSHTIHGPNKYLMSQDVPVSGDLQHDPKLSAGWHTYTVIRTADSITTKVDDTVAVHLTKASAPPTLDWVFDQPMNILFSLAVGGKFPGNPDASTPRTSKMLIDWIAYSPRT